jgi:hypothetical protein
MGGSLTNDSDLRATALHHAIQVPNGLGPRQTDAELAARAQVFYEFLRGDRPNGPVPAPTES